MNSCVGTCWGGTDVMKGSSKKTTKAEDRFSGRLWHRMSVALASPSVAVVNPESKFLSTAHKLVNCQRLGMAAEVETIGEAPSAAEGSVLPEAEATHEVRGC